MILIYNAWHLQKNEEVELHTGIIHLDLPKTGKKRCLGG